MYVPQIGMSDRMPETCIKMSDKMPYEMAKIISERTPEKNMPNKCRNLCQIEGPRK